MWRRNRRSNQEPAAGNPINVALIGLGAMGQRNASNLVKSPAFRLVGVYDLNDDLTKTVARQSGAHAVDNIDAILSDDEIESVFVCTPHHLLAEQGLRVLNAGKHLLIEKPMAIDTASADALIDVAIERGKTIAVNYARALTDTVQIARKLVDQGAVGDLQGIEIRWSYYKPPGYFQGVHSPAPDDWRLHKDKAGGGMVIMTTCHALHYVTHITGAKFRSVAAFTPNDPAQQGVEDTLYGSFKFENNATGALLTSSNQRGIQVSDTTIWGSNGTVILVGDEVKYYSTRVIDGKRPGKWYTEKGRPGPGYFSRWLTDTAAFIKGTKEPTFNAESARDTLAVINALYKSAESGAVVQIEYRN